MKFISISPRDPKVRRIGVGLLAALVLLGAVWIVTGLPDRGIPGKTEDERLEYLRSLGWEPCCSHMDEKSILLPKEFPDVLKNYNEIQLAQGFDLTKYAGKEIKMYTCGLSNFPEDPNAQCSLYVYRGKIIGGDVHSPGINGFMLPLNYRQAEQMKENG